MPEPQAVQRLRSIQSSHPYIRFTGVFNPHLRRYITKNLLNTDSKKKYGATPAGYRRMRRG